MKNLCLSIDNIKRVIRQGTEEIFAIDITDEGLYKEFPTIKKKKN